MVEANLTPKHPRRCWGCRLARRRYDWRAEKGLPEIDLLTLSDLYAARNILGLPDLGPPDLLPERARKLLREALEALKAGDEDKVAELLAVLDAVLSTGEAEAWAPFADWTEAEAG